MARQRRMRMPDPHRLSDAAEMFPRRSMPDQVKGQFVADVALRPIDDFDLDALFDQMRDPEPVRMAAQYSMSTWRRSGRRPRSFWGQGIAGRALVLLLESVLVRPL